MTKTQTTHPQMAHCVMALVMAIAGGCSRQAPEGLPAQPIFEHFARAELVDFDGDVVTKGSHAPMDTLVFGRVVDVANANPAKTFFTQNCLVAVTGNENEVSWVRVGFEIDLVVGDVHGDAIDDDMIEIITLHRDGTSPLKTLSDAHERIGIRVPRVSEWEADLPVRPIGTLDPPSVVPEGHELELECERQGAADLHAHASNGNRVFRGFDVDGRLGNPMTVDGHPDDIGLIPPRDMKYTMTEDEVCALGYLRTNGTAEPIKSYTVKLPQSKEEAVTAEWCWPREQVECFTEWRSATGSTTNFDCASLGPLEVSATSDAGTSVDGGG